MTGVVSAELEAVIVITVRGPYGHHQLKAVLDTGFTDYLTLAPELISALGMTFSHSVEGTLANGESARFNAYEAVVDWDGAAIDIVVIASDGGPLIGTALIRGNLVCLELIPSGAVYTEPLP